MTTRRQFLLASASGVLTSRLAAAQGRAVTIGMLGPRARSFFVPAVWQRLAELGFREGPNVRIEYRHVDGVVERFPQIARELVALHCDLIFAIGSEHAARALLDARVSAPVVFLAIDYDPLEKKIVDSLARPGRNITGLYSLNREITLKRLEIVQEVLPAARRVLVFSDIYSRDQLASLRKVADARRVQLSVAEFTDQPYKYAEALAAGGQGGVDALLVLTSPVFADDRMALDELSLSRRLPAVGFATPEGNFLVSYSADSKKMSHRVAEIGVQILRGAKPGDIPVQQADEFELVVNLKTAKALGVKIPYSVLARATRLIE